jgi:hypothetical protein
VICVQRLSPRETRREFGNIWPGTMATPCGACPEHNYYSVVPIPRKRGRLPKALSEALLARLLMLHEQSGVCDCREHGPCTHGRHR